MSEKIKKAAMGISLLLSCTLPLSEMFGEELSFRARKDFTVGFQPMSIVSGDFNGDAVLDLAVANMGGVTDSGSVSILIGNGGGTFRAPFTIKAGPRPRTLAVGDFNEDGILDLALTYEEGHHLSIHLGDGVGGFRLQRDFAVVGDTVATGDFNKDGHLDLVVGGRFSRVISIFLGNGDGTFETAIDTYVGGELNAVAIGDFNNDGIPDLVIGHGYDYPFITFLLGDGDGRFQTARALPGYGARSVMAADFNGDNNLDIVTEQALLLGRGDGTFTFAAVFLGLGDGPRFTVAVGDFNGDGNLDVALTTQLYLIYILLGNGDGTFQPPTRITMGPAPRSIFSGDFNGDGYSDLVVANTNFSDSRLGTISVMLGSGDGRFYEAEAIRTGYNSALLSGDFNQDGRLDVAVVSYTSPSQPGDVRIFLGDGTGHFQAPRSFSVGDGPTAAVLGDFNGDGALDVATANGYSGDVSILLGQGGGSFQPARHFRVGDRPSAITAGDFNGDQVLDLAVACDYSARVSILLGQGDGGFQAARDIALPRASVCTILVADFNGDSMLDLAVAYRNERTVSILLGNGDGSFQAARDFPVIGVNLEGSLAVADLNGDGLLDLVVGGSGSVSILMGRGDGTFQAARFLSIGFGPNSPTQGDFNGDGILDLAVSNRVLANVSLLLGNSDGTFRFIQDFGVTAESILSIAGDFNTDDRQDLIVLNFEHITVLLNDTVKP